MPYKSKEAYLRYQKEYKRRRRRAAGIPEHSKRMLTPEQVVQKKTDRREYNREWKRKQSKAWRDKQVATIKAWRHRLRRKMIEMYGGKCACCGESEFVFLAIDHVDGGGTKHIRSYRTYTAYMLWMTEELRPGFRVLCHNCNMATARGQICPHQLKNNEQHNS